MIKQQINQLLEQDMDRREFIRSAGLAFLALMGVTAFVKQLSSLGSKPSSRSEGYGSSAYGGK